MQEITIFIQNIDETKRTIDWVELNNLKKDILWIFDENGKYLVQAFVPAYSFTLPYWEYVTIHGANLYDEEKHFYQQGALIILLCMIVEYVDIPGGDRMIFGNNKIETIGEHINRFETLDESQIILKKIVMLGLSIADSISEEDFARNEDFKHSELETFYSKLAWVSETFIRPYYIAKLK